jgi:hypothetical protein
MTMRHAYPINAIPPAVPEFAFPAAFPVSEQSPEPPNIATDISDTGRIEDAGIGRFCAGRVLVA